MVQVDGTTYRVVGRAQFHDVFRLLDDACVGTFRHEPCLQIVRHEIPYESLLEVARQAMRSARLSWSPRKTSAYGVAAQGMWSHVGAGCAELTATLARNLLAVRWVWSGVGPEPARSSVRGGPHAD